MQLRLTWKRIAAAAVGASLLGLLVAWSGVIGIGASSGHWKVTDWFLHWVMQNSVRTHAIGITAPPLDRPELVRRGAGHFATGCAPCHGAPGEPRNPVVLRQTPPPPALDDLGHWKDRELFWIVENGVKFTAMPAWPAAGRDDEVWAVVAFLRAMQDMPAERYRTLAFGGEPPSAGLAALSQPATAVLADCARCHGRDGNGRDAHGQVDGAFPILAGQGERYLHDALEAYAAGRRHSGIMQPAAHRAGAAERSALAAHYARQTPAAREPPAAANERLAELGAAIAQVGLPSQGVPACFACHDAPARARNPGFPRLDGQPADYLATQLRLWRDDMRGGGPYAHLMRRIAHELEPEQIDAVAVFFAGRQE